MDFGRLPTVDHVDFSLPADPPGNKLLLNSKASGEDFRLYIGAPVWGAKEWMGTIYPKDASEKQFLFHYSRQFNSIELNQTYYRIPSPATVMSWKSNTPPHFTFFPKIPQEISHTRLLSDVHDLTYALCEALEPLGGKLGTFFLQLPPWFGPAEAHLLKAFISGFPQQHKLAVEFRNENWFMGNHFAEMISFLEEHDAGTVITDTAGRRDVLHMRLTNTTAFIRFTANDLHPTDFPRVDAWAERIKLWREEGLQACCFFVHSPNHPRIPEITDHAVRKFNEVLGTSLSSCRFIEEQKTLFG